MSFEFLFAALERGLTETDDTVDSLIVGAVRNILNLLMDRMHKHEGTGVLKMVFKSLPRLHAYLFLTFSISTLYLVEQ